MNNFSRAILKKIAKSENVELSFLEKNLYSGKILILKNKNSSNKRFVAIGKGLKIKINTNIGTSTEKTQIVDEIQKLQTAIKYGTDTVMDLSVGGNLTKIREEILKHSIVPVGTVPIYEAAKISEEKYGDFSKMDFNLIWDILNLQAKEGIDFFTIHAGILKKAIDLLKKEKRIGGIVSRGGAILARWMYINKKENLLYENFEKILTLAKQYNITLSLGDALRPGSIADSTDTLQIQELKVLAELVKKAFKKGVQVMVEGPGHIKLDQIAYNVRLQKKLCYQAPFYVLGPIPTDISAGYDHISASIGAAVAALAGADFLCVVTPAEHLRHPTVEDIKEGVIATKIAAHCVDVLRFSDEFKKDYKASIYRTQRNWKKLFPLLIDSQKAKKYRNLDTKLDLCTMCGKFCSLKIIENCNLIK